MVASNRDPQDWYPFFPNPVLAEGVLHRENPLGHMREN